MKMTIMILMMDHPEFIELETFYVYSIIDFSNLKLFFNFFTYTIEK